MHSKLDAFALGSTREMRASVIHRTCSKGNPSGSNLVIGSNLTSSKSAKVERWQRFGGIARATSSLMNSKSRNRHAHTSTQPLQSFSPVPELSSVCFASRSRSFAPSLRRRRRRWGDIASPSSVATSELFSKISFVFPPLFINQSQSEKAAAPPRRGERKRIA